MLHVKACSTQAARWEAPLAEKATVVAGRQTAVSFATNTSGVPSCPAEDIVADLSVGDLKILAMLQQRY